MRGGRTIVRSGAALLVVACGAAAPDAPAPVDAPPPGVVPPVAPDAAPTNDAGGSDGASSGTAGGPGLGLTWDDAAGLVHARVFSSRATRLELWIYDAPVAGRVVRVLELARAGDVWEGAAPIAELPAVAYYGLRAWGPNWPYVEGWTPGSAAGFVADVDGEGNRFDPNKLLLDPYAREVSHDATGPLHRDHDVFRAGPAHRARDSGPFAPKGVLARPPRLDDPARPPRPARPWKDAVVYEVHLRGLTRADPAVPEDERGTYAGAARKARYLRELGVTAVELLPIQETPNDQNDLDPSSANGDNYWGYSTSAYFAPDRRYARDRSPFGPTRELAAMVDAFHAEGLQVLLDVVYNHTAEGGAAPDGTAALLSFRGLDNAAYYELGTDPARYRDDNGVAPNLNAAHPRVRDLVVDSLRWFHDAIGVDGFRFDLAPVLANGCARACFRWEPGDPENALNRAARAFPGAPLVAEPWAVTAGTYRLGEHPAGWSEWNGVFRDAVRRDQNRLGRDEIRPRELRARLEGSPDFFGDDGRRPWHSVNFVVAHDGFTLADLYAYDAKQNAQPYPYGPSNGGSDDNLSWSQAGEPARQEQAARTGLALLFASAGVPMITGGDELRRSQRGNNNAYNLDASSNWIDWSRLDAERAFFEYTRRWLAFRAAHPALRPDTFRDGRDHDGNGLRDVVYLRDDGREVDGAYLDDPARHFLAWRLDGAEAGDPAPSIYVAYNGWSGSVVATLPPGRWERGGGDVAVEVTGPTAVVPARTVLVLAERR